MSTSQLHLLEFYLSYALAAIPDHTRNSIVMIKKSFESSMNANARGLPLHWQPMNPQPVNFWPNSSHAPKKTPVVSNARFPPLNRNQGYMAEG